jgi:hypothetical protein
MPLLQVVATDVQGNEYDTVPTNKSTNAKQNGGAAAKINDTSLLVGVAVSYEDLGVFGSTVIDNDNTSKALNAGEFAFDNNHPVAKKLTSSLSTVSNDILVSGASVPGLRRSIHSAQVCGEGCTDGTRDNEGNIVVFANDVAANPSRSVPGKLTFKTGAKLPVTDAYSPKTT